MNPTSEPRRTYHRHRENQRERILDAAEELFLQLGIDAVTVGQISRKARISRMTLYEYFPDKPEIAWAVFQKVVGEMRAVAEPEMIALTGSGYARLERYIQVRINGFYTHLEQFRFIALFNFLYAREGSPERMRGALEQAWPGLSAKIVQMLQDGIADGSVRPNLDPGLTAAALGNLMAGMTSRFALLGSNIPREYSYGFNEMYQEIFVNFLLGVRAHSD